MNKKKKKKTTIQIPLKKKNYYSSLTNFLPIRKRKRTSETETWKSFYSSKNRNENLKNPKKKQNLIYRELLRSLGNFGSKRRAEKSKGSPEAAAAAAAA